MNRNVIITCAVTGAGDALAKHPDLPALILGTASGTVGLTNKTWKLISSAGYGAGFSLTTEVYTDNISEIVVPPFQVNPPNGITDVTAPTLEWLASAGATNYRIQIALDSNFSTIIRPRSKRPARNWRKISWSSSSSCRRK